MHFPLIYWLMPAILFPPEVRQWVVENAPLLAPRLLPLIGGSVMLDYGFFGWPLGPLGEAMDVVI